MTWKQFNQQPDYEVSDNGLVRVLFSPYKCYIGKILKQHVVGGYPRVSLRINGQRKMLSVHRLVCHSFLGECPDGFQVNHKNGIKTDNRIGNLEYVTRSQNVRHAYETGLSNPVKNLPHLVGDEIWHSRLSNKQADEVRELFRLSGLSQVSIGKIFGVNKYVISRIVRGVTYRTTAP